MNGNVTDFRCPECGASAKEIKEGRAVGMRCTNCDWSVVTSYFSPIELDTTVYAVRIASGNPHDQQQVKLIAQLAGCNFLQARKLMQEKLSVIFQGKAPQVLAAKKSLIDANFVVAIEPDFKW